jgi:hypothetical protein
MKLALFTGLLISIISANPFNCYSVNDWKTDPHYSDMLICYNSIYSDANKYNYVTYGNPCSTPADCIVTFCYYDIYNDFPPMKSVSVTSTQSQTLTPSYTLTPSRTQSASQCLRGCDDDDSKKNNKDYKRDDKRSKDDDDKKI